MNRYCWIVDNYDRLAHALDRLSPMPEGYAASLRETFVARSFAAGAHFINAGETATGVGFVVRGLFKYFYIDHEGKERIKTIAMENDFVVSYASLITGTPSAYFIAALEESEVLVIDREAYLQGVEHDPYWATIARKYVEQLFVDKVRREASLLMEDAGTRYEHFVLHHRELHNRLRLKDIASFLGMTDVTLSRVRRNRS
jgi:CRP-like cAMP-binding protein